MTEKMKKPADCGDSFCPPPPELVMSARADLIHREILNLLDELVADEELQPGGDRFYSMYCNFLLCYDRLMQEVTAASGIVPVCSPGCSHCCFHWVDDVNSFEAPVIVRFFMDNFPDTAVSAMNLFREDTEAFHALSESVRNSVSLSAEHADGADFYELILSRFYQLKRPCPLLDENGRCSVYPVRPLTCRDYLNLRHPSACLPELISDENYATLIISLSDEISERLDILHNRFDKQGETSLRSMMTGMLNC